MSLELQTLLWCLVALTLGLLYRTHIQLPERLDRRLRQSLQAFGTAFELRFPMHKGQTSRVCNLCLQVGHKLEFPQAVIRNIEAAAQLRDVGLCALPYRLGEGRPFDQWTAAERAAYMKHSDLSANMLEYLPALQNLAPIVRQHHLPYRGPTATGSTPRANLPVEARVLKTVTDYVWFERWQGPMLALESLRAGSDTEYDPVIVSALVAVLTSGVEDRAGAEPAIASSRFETLKVEH